MWLIDASDAWLGGWCDACEGMGSDCSWELWNMGGSSNHDDHKRTGTNKQGAEMNQFDKTVSAVRRAMPQKSTEAVRRWLGGAGVTKAQLRAIQATARRLYGQ